MSKELGSKLLTHGHLGSISGLKDAISLLSLKRSCSFHNTKCIEATSKRSKDLKCSSIAHNSRFKVSTETQGKLLPTIPCGKF